MDITASTLKDYFNRYVSSFVNGEVFHHGTIVGVLKTCAGNDGNYRLVLKELTGKTSSKELSDAQWSALYRFVMPIKPMGEKWHSKHTNEELKRWCNMLVTASLNVPEQMKFETGTTEPAGDDAEYIAWLYDGENQ